MFSVKFRSACLFFVAIQNERLGEGCDFLIEAFRKSDSPVSWNKICAPDRTKIVEKNLKCIQFTVNQYGHNDNDCSIVAQNHGDDM